MARLNMLIKEVTLFRQRMRRVMIKKLRNILGKIVSYIHYLYLLIIISFDPAKGGFELSTYLVQ